MYLRVTLLHFVAGSIYTNGAERQLALFNKLSAYIMQEDLLQSHLTVYESLLVAAHLKLGNELNQDEKRAAVSIRLFFPKRFDIDRGNCNS
jgi:hypothetical protein